LQETSNLVFFFLEAWVLQSRYCILYSPLLLLHLFSLSAPFLIVVYRRLLPSRKKPSSCSPPSSAPGIPCSRDPPCGMLICFVLLLRSSFLARFHKALTAVSTPLNYFPFYSRSSLWLTPGLLFQFSPRPYRPGISYSPFFLFCFFFRSPPHCPDDVRRNLSATQCCRCPSPVFAVALFFFSLINSKRLIAVPFGYKFACRLSRVLPRCLGLVIVRDFCIAPSSSLAFFLPGPFTFLLLLFSHFFVPGR